MLDQAFHEIVEAIDRAADECAAEGVDVGRDLARLRREVERLARLATTRLLVAA